MLWTRVAVAIAVLTLVPGCVMLMESRHLVAGRYDVAGRPAQSYYCYDCHGYRYLDPYYDWCPGHGFRYDWRRHPETVRVYRERYVRIKEANPSYGRYRYPTRYREVRRYREPQDYEQWRSGARSAKPQAPGDLKVREKPRREPGTKMKDPGGEKRDSGPRPAQKPREERPSDARRSVSLGGE